VWIKRISYQIHFLFLCLSLSHSLSLLRAVSLFSSLLLYLCACGWLQEKAKMLQEDIASKQQQV